MRTRILANTAIGLFMMLLFTGIADSFDAGNSGADASADAGVYFPDGEATAQTPAINEGAAIARHSRCFSILKAKDIIGGAIKFTPISETTAWRRNPLDDGAIIATTYNIVIEDILFAKDGWTPPAEVWLDGGRMGNVESYRASSPKIKIGSTYTAFIGTGNWEGAIAGTSCSVIDFEDDELEVRAVKEVALTAVIGG